MLDALQSWCSYPCSLPRNLRMWKAENQTPELANVLGQMAQVGLIDYIAMS